MALEEGKKSFVLYTKYKEAIEELDDEEAGILLKTLFKYVCDEEPEIPRSIKQTFNMIKIDLKEDLAKWRNRCEVNKANGSLGGRPKTTKTEENPKNPNGFSNNQSKPKKADNDYDNDNEYIKENNNTNNCIIKEKSTKSRFYPPTLEEIKAYCNERRNLVDAEKWYDFYSSKGWMIGKNKMKDWKAAIRTWEKEAGFKNEDDGDNGGFRKL